MDWSDQAAEMQRMRDQVAQLQLALQQKEVQLEQKDVELQQKDVELQQKDMELQQKTVELQQSMGNGQHHNQDKVSSSCWISTSSTPAKPQAAAFVTLQEDDVLGVLGTGWTGDVFLYRHNGRSTALKVGHLTTAEGGSLVKEHAVYRHLKPVWHVWIPGVELYGITEDGEGVMLATTHIVGRHFNKALDRDLRPQLKEALSAVHHLGVAHRDLRPPNILVEDRPGGSKRVWLVDFGHACMNASRRQQDVDWIWFEDLFYVPKRTTLA